MEPIARKNGMFRGLHPVRGVFLMVLLLGAAVQAVAQVERTTPPVQLVLTASPVELEDAAYNFEVIITEFKSPQGISKLRMTVNIVKVCQGQVTRFVGIVQSVTREVSVIEIVADGQRFSLEACYREPSTRAADARYIGTTFGKMFAGGRTGLLAKIVDQ